MVAYSWGIGSYNNQIQTQVRRLLQLLKFLDQAIAILDMPPEKNERNQKFSEDLKSLRSELSKLK
jgi:hypothetical protein